jgi:hypothetical protein
MSFLFIDRFFFKYISFIFSFLSLILKLILLALMVMKIRAFFLARIVMNSGREAPMKTNRSVLKDPQVCTCRSDIFEKALKTFSV